MSCVFFGRAGTGAIRVHSGELKTAGKPSLVEAFQKPGKNNALRVRNRWERVTKKKHLPPGRCFLFNPYLNFSYPDGLFTYPDSIKTYSIAEKSYSVG